MRNKKRTVLELLCRRKRKMCIMSSPSLFCASPFFRFSTGFDFYCGVFSSLLLSLPPFCESEGETRFLHNIVSGWFAAGSLPSPLYQRDQLFFEQNAIWWSTADGRTSRWRPRPRRWTHNTNGSKKKSFAPKTTTTKFYGQKTFEIFFLPRIEEEKGRRRRRRERRQETQQRQLFNPFCPFPPSPPTLFSCFPFSHPSSFVRSTSEILFHAHWSPSSFISGPPPPPFRWG